MNLHGLLFLGSRSREWLTGVCTRRMTGGTAETINVVKGITGVMNQIFGTAFEVLAQVTDRTVVGIRQKGL